MHELSLAEGIRRIVEDAARAHRAGRVTRVVLEVGELAAVEMEALDFCLAAALRGGVADGAAVEVREVAGAGRCPGCGAEVALHERYDPCPRCGAYGLRPTAGTELRVKAVELG
jgi:hydrogenase nickel incorporation protein HypA/HybF